LKLLIEEGKRCSFIFLSDDFRSLNLLGIIALQKTRGKSAIFKERRKLSKLFKAAWGYFGKELYSWVKPTFSKKKLSGKTEHLLAEHRKF